MRNDGIDFEGRIKKPVGKMMATFNQRRGAYQIKPYIIKLVKSSSHLPDTIPSHSLRTLLSQITLFTHCPHGVS